MFDQRDPWITALVILVSVIVVKIGVHNLEWGLKTVGHVFPQMGRPINKETIITWSKCVSDREVLSGDNVANGLNCYLMTNGDHAWGHYPSEWLALLILLTTWERIG